MWIPLCDIPSTNSRYFDLFSLVAATAALLMPGIARDAHRKIFGLAFQAAEEAIYDECVRALQSAGVRSN